MQVTFLMVITRKKIIFGQRMNIFPLTYKWIFHIPHTRKAIHFAKAVIPSKIPASNTTQKYNRTHMSTYIFRYFELSPFAVRSFILSLSMENKEFAHVLEILSIECELVKRLSVPHLIFFTLHIDIFIHVIIYPQSFSYQTSTHHHWIWSY